MEGVDDDEDLKLIRASAALLSDLEASLPRLLWRPTKTGASHGPVHTRVRQRDLNHVVNLIEPFQGEPQLLDAKLKHILPPMVEAYLEYLRLDPKQPRDGCVSLQTAVCTILYVLCKVRGAKVIVGFLNNEPKHLEPILGALETASSGNDRAWQVPYVLLLWLSHLLLTPFDLSSISSGQDNITFTGLGLPSDLPSAQDAAAAALLRLAIRPDMQRLGLADALVQNALAQIQVDDEKADITMYSRLGHLRFLAGIATSAELSHLIPTIYRACEKLSASSDDSTTSSNAVAKKLMVKIFRNIVILSLRSASAEGPLLEFMEMTSVLEDVIDYLLRSLADRDTPVRYAAAKGISLIVQELNSDMGHEVIQAVLDTFKEDMPRSGKALDFRSANALKWHGLTLALSHALFKRTASPEQIADIVRALVSALQFEQRTATGSSVGTNVRDAANFGIWSLSRRYTTNELLSVDTASLQMPAATKDQSSVIQTLAVQLVLSACLDPAGNVRRGSSAALQELVGRHPNQVHAGIPLVQLVDYQAVGLRRRGLFDVAGTAAALHDVYWYALVDGLLGWRGIGSVDVVSRESTALSLARLSSRTPRSQYGVHVIDRVQMQLDQCSYHDAETAHGLVLTVASLVKSRMPDGLTSGPETTAHEDEWQRLLRWSLIARSEHFLGNFSSRVLRSELPSAVVQLLDAVCLAEATQDTPSTEAMTCATPLSALETLVERLLSRHEDTILHGIPSLVHSLLALERRANQRLGALALPALNSKVIQDSIKSTLAGAGRAIALGALASGHAGDLVGDEAAIAIKRLSATVDASIVDWRVIGLRALQIAIESAVVHPDKSVDAEILRDICRAVHRGLSDYTIDERGDVGSLVRLQGIACTMSMLDSSAFAASPAFYGADDGTFGAIEGLRADMARLSLEKLDRVRVQAARCRSRLHHFSDQGPTLDIPAVSSYHYFHDAALVALSATDTGNQAAVIATWEGLISCSGTAAEPLLVASREALADILASIPDQLLQARLTTFYLLLTRLVVEASNNVAPALELLSFLLSTNIPYRLSINPSEFKWRNLLSTVQKSHFKSPDVPRILSAVKVYRGLAEVVSIRGEVLKKLLSMVKTNPYPRVRVAVAETLFIVLETEDKARMKRVNWSRTGKENAEVIKRLEGCIST
ncbi:Tubulin folding cofactor D C terminal [Teratosphaeria destructans]|uniref:Tubulin folding cofactor D C terminal n=1 Tax=Teratosphaeria destructans TaxID=418781 RepID=A0A9W7T0V3_9PEZI|nr:Tubulin folding cofactor D C terminal [Teratosphaeria destructans]